MNAIGIALMLIAIAIAGTTIAATILVSIASRREDSQGTLIGPATGPVESLARRILAVGTEGESARQLARPTANCLPPEADDRMVTPCRPRVLSRRSL